MKAMTLFRRVSPRIAVLVALVLVAALVIGAGGALGHGSTTMTLQFSQTKGLYEGDAVTILGVPVGNVTSVDPHPRSVTVRVEVDDEHPIPADARAVLVAPSLVSVRRIEIGPVYDGGPRLADGATIPISRTAIPVEWDEVKEQLVRLTEALGDDGANKDGSLDDLLEVSARNLKGRGNDMKTTITSLSRAMETLSDGRGDLFATVRNLQVLVEAIEQSDAQVAEFNGRLADVSEILADDSADLSAALDGLERAFPRVQKFLRKHGKDLTATVDELRQPAAMLADNRQKLADILQVAPGTLSNFYNIIDPDVPALTGAFALTNFQAPAVFICSALYSLGGTPQDCQDTLEPIAKYLKIDAPPVGLVPLLRDGRRNVEPAPGSSTSSSSAAAVPESDLLGQLTKNGGGAR